MSDVASAVVGKGAVLRARSAGPLRLLTPARNWIVTSSLGGGLVDGDAVALDVTVEAGATAVVTTQASTKVYKGSSRQSLTVHVHGDGTALLVPDAIVPYRGATFAQTTRVAMASASTLVACDIVTAGRVAHGERWNATRIDTALRIEIDGVARVIDRIVITDATQLGTFEALATAVLLGPRVRAAAAEQLAALTPVVRGAAVIVTGSTLADGAMFRIAGARIEDVIAATRALVSPACRACNEMPWARKW